MMGPEINTNHYAYWIWLRTAYSDLPFRILGKNEQPKGHSNAQKFEVGKSRC